MSALGVKRTSACALHMSAFDPKRTCTSSEQSNQIREQLRRSLVAVLQHAAKIQFIPATRTLIVENAGINLPRDDDLWGTVLNNDRVRERKDKFEQLAKLKQAALAELERRGYEVRGKTPAQIREMLKRRPKKVCAN